MKAKEVVGRKIIRVELNRRSDGRGGWTFDPVFYLDNGTAIKFSVNETEYLEYGITPRIER